MPFIIYDDQPKGYIPANTRSKESFHEYAARMGAVHYEEHLSNHHYLKFLHDNSTDFNERQQCNKEMQIAQKKIDFWQRAVSREQQVQIALEIKQKWSQPQRKRA